MPHAGHTVTVNPPAGTVFDYLADGTHDTEWRSGVLEIERTSPADGKGATYRQVLSGPGGRRIDGDYRVTVFNPPTRLEFQVVAGPARPAGVFELTETTPGTTTVRFTLDLRPPRPHLPPPAASAAHALRAARAATGTGVTASWRGRPQGRSGA